MRKLNNGSLWNCSDTLDSLEIRHESRLTTDFTDRPIDGPPGELLVTKYIAAW